MTASKWLLSLICLSAFVCPLSAQLGSASEEKSPIEIYSDGGTRFEGGLAIAENNVVIYANGARMYGDYAQYNPETKDVLLKGHVKIFQGATIFAGESAFYNLETKAIRSSDFLGASKPYHFQGDNLYSMEGGAFSIKNGFFTTHDSSEPDYRLRARSVRIYPDNRVIFSNVTLFVGRTPIFWWPYLYQSLDEANAFLVTPGYSGKWGAFLLGSYTFPVTEKMLGRLHVDYRSARGPALGLDLEYKGAKPTKGDPQSYSNILSYILHDSKTDENQTSLARPEIDPERYRLSWRAKLYMSEDWTATIDANKLSDSKLLEDFYPGENRLDPQPDTVAALTKASERWTFTALARAQWNEFQQTTERLPELALDVTRGKLFGSPIYYEGETSVGVLNKAFPEGFEAPDAKTLRADTFHQISYPNTYFGWLSVVPRAGFRATYYSETGTTSQSLRPSTIDRIGQLQTVMASRSNLITENEDRIATLNGQLAIASPAEAAVIRSEITQLQFANANLQAANTQTGGNIVSLQNGSLIDVYDKQGADVRTVFNFGVESSFKVSRTFDNVESRWAGLDGLKHVVQPYVNFSYVAAPSVGPDNLLPIDVYIPSTQLAPFDFPQSVALDSIDQASVLRLGVRNRLLTKRNDQSFTWLELDTFFNVNYENPYDTSDFSNVFNRLRFNPVPWMSLTVDSQLPILADGFSEVNTGLTFMPTSDLTFSLGHRYLQENPFFANSSLVSLSAYYQIDPNWAVSLNERYELEDSVLESQRYTLHRDLTSWIASVSAVIRDNRGGKEDVGLFLTFTLKDLPNLNLNFNVDPGSTSDE
ncbi:MAG TPA: LPS assembly protein LptD [Chthoniobacterales bacterium]